ncbi:MAG: ABC transporter substrate-binding protein [Desulfobacteraceae bacterium]|nr:ABC transporter substrate-binding protein [Desulfobacteraceae bacterium]
MRKNIKYLTAVIFISLLIFFPFSGCKTKNKVFYIGILQWSEKVEAFNQSCRGVLDGLKNKGYKQGSNLKTDYRNAEQDKKLALEIAKEFVSNKVDLIITLGTGSSLAALEATENNRIPIVFTIVGAPKATDIIDDYDDAGRNITGISMKIPVKEQFGLVKEVFPEIRNLGIIYCTEMPQAIATGKEASAAVADFGWIGWELAFPKKKLYELHEMVLSMVQKTDAVYIPIDPVLHASENLKTILDITDEHRIPVIVVTEKTVEKGAVMAVHCDFYEIGYQAGNPVVQIFEGADVQTIPSQKPVIKKFSLNLKKAKKLNIEIRRNIIVRADNIFD